MPTNDTVIHEFRAAQLNSTVPTEVELFATAILAVVAVVGTLGNLLTIIAVSKSRKLRKISNIYIVNLAVVDLLVCAFLTPVSVYTMITGQEPIFGCNSLLPYFSMLCTTVSILNFSAIAINRYIAIVKGRALYRTCFTKLRCTISIVIIWILGAAVSLPPLVGYGRYGYDIKFGICFVPGHDRENYWFIFGICFIFATPFLMTTTYSYTQIIRKFYKIQKRRKSYSSPSCSAISEGPIPITYQFTKPIITPEQLRPAKYPRRSLTMSNSTDILAVRRIDQHQMQVFRVAFNCIVIWLFFLVVWMPILGLHVVDYDYVVAPEYYRTLFAIAYTNFAVNAFIYAGLNRNFRVAYKNILLCRCNPRTNFDM